MKLKWFVADVSAPGSPDRADHAILEVLLAERCFLPIQAAFVVGDPLCDVGISA